MTPFTDITFRFESEAAWMISVFIPFFDNMFENFGNMVTPNDAIQGGEILAMTMTARALEMLLAS